MLFRSYLTRILHNLGEAFVGYQIADSGRVSLFHAVAYAISGLRSGSGSVALTNATASEICRWLSINLIIVGPDNSNVEIVMPGDKQNGFVLLYRSYENFYFPIISLEKKSCHLLYEHNNTLIQSILSGKPLSVADSSVADEK